LALVAACAVEPVVATQSSEVIIANHILVDHIVANRAGINRLAATRLASGRVTGLRMKVSPSAAALLATPEGQDVFGLMVTCAMPAQVSIVATIGGSDVEFAGDAGLAPQWLFGGLDESSQRWVSACMLARVNGNDLMIPISMRGPSAALASSGDERATWTLEEGAFFGNVFTPVGAPIQWFACRGRDKAAAGNVGNLADRTCAAPDPANPGFTLCGFTFAGDCGSFAADQACESFSSTGTYYRQCHTAPLQARGCAAHIFPEAITTFVSP
jgi:hypothetical protein